MFGLEMQAAASRLVDRAGMQHGRDMGPVGDTGRGRQDIIGPGQWGGDSHPAKRNGRSGRG